MSEFTRLAWELARTAKFELDPRRPDRPVRATVRTLGGDVAGWGRTHTEALRHLAEGLDLYAKEFAEEPIPIGESVATGPTIHVSTEAKR